MSTDSVNRNGRNVSNGQIHNDGNGRLWERFQLSDINDRLINLYEHLRDVVQEFAPPPPDYSGTVHDIQSLFNNHQAAVTDIASKWKKSLALKTQENHQLNDEIKRLRAMLNNAKRDSAFRNGIEHYIAMRTNEMEQALQSVIKQKDDALQLLEQERRKHAEYRQKYEQLTKTMEEMQKQDTYNVDNELLDERNEYRRKYEDLCVKYERKKFELDEKFGSALEAICGTIQSTKCFDPEEARKLWQEDLDKLNKIYDDRLTQKELDWQKAKNQSMRTLDEEYTHLSNGIKEALQFARNENSELKRSLKQKEEEHERVMTEYDVKIANLREAMKQAEVDNDRLQSAGSENEELKMTMKQNEDSYKRRLVEYDVQISNLRASIKQAETDRDRFRRQHEDKSKQLAGKLREMTDLQTELSNLRELTQRAETDRDEFRVQHDKKSELLTRKLRENMDLQTELSKYKVLWQHFFGLDADLKTEIDLAQQRLSKLERRHNIQSPVPQQQRRVEVESLQEWMKMYSFPPLMVDSIPLPNDRYQRFQLFNYSNVAIKLKNFCITTDKKHSFRIDPNIQIRGHGYITVALKEQQKPTDILVPSSFRFTFKENERLFLDDGQQKVQIFPQTETVHTRLDQFSESPLKAVPLEEKTDDDKVRGFMIHNVANCPITLVGHYFRNERNTFRADIPCKLIAPRGSFRLITVEDDSADYVDARANDIVVPFDAIRMDVDDKLLLCDGSQNMVELYEWKKSDNNHNHNGNGANVHSCFVM